MIHIKVVLSLYLFTMPFPITLTTTIYHHQLTQQQQLPTTPALPLSISLTPQSTYLLTLGQYLHSTHQLIARCHFLPPPPPTTTTTISDHTNSTTIKLVTFSSYIIIIISGLHRSGRGYFKLFKPPASLPALKFNLSVGQR